MSKKLAIHGGKPVRTKPFPAYKTIGIEEKKAVNKVLDSGLLSKYLGTWSADFNGGPQVQEFEKEWASYFGIKHAIAVNSCTSGLQCAVGATVVSPGDEIIVSPYTMSASVVAPLWYGAIPVFADIEEKYFCLDPISVENRITEKTRAIIVVDLFGQPYDKTKINEIAQKHNLTVIEDCAQAPGAKYGNDFAGTLGDIGVYSLNYHKHIHTGEGGMIVTNDDVLADRLRLIRNHAESVIEAHGGTDLTNMIGCNFRLTEIQAAIGRVQLRKLKDLNEKRIANAEYLAQELNKIKGIQVAEIRPNTSHVCYNQVLLYDEKIINIPRSTFVKAVRSELPSTELREQEGPLLSAGYVKPLYLLPLFQQKKAIGSKGYPFSMNDNINYEKGICPVVERMHEKELLIHEFMRPPAQTQDLDDVVNAFKKVSDLKNELIT